MKGRRLISITLNVMDDLIKGNLREASTDDIPSDLCVIAVYQTDDDRLRHALSVLVESSEWPALPVGSIPPRLAPVYTKKPEGR